MKMNGVRCLLLTIMGRTPISHQIHGLCFLGEFHTALQNQYKEVVVIHCGFSLTCFKNVILHKSVSNICFYFVLDYTSRFICEIIIIFLSFREIFFVPEDMLLVPKVYTTIPSFRLHVVDNDTLEEMPHVFFKVAPCVYPQNKVNKKCCCEKDNF